MDLNKIFSTLGQAVTNRQHPWHEMTVATSHQGAPDARRVVLRGFVAERRQIFFHTDCRAPKIAVLRDNPHMAIVFYDPESRLQLRLPSCRVRIHHQDEITQARWQTTRDFSKLCYTVASAPGTVLPAPPIDMESWRPEWEDMAYENFAVVIGEFNHIDILQLRHGGHHRWRANWQDGDWRVQVIQA